MNTTESFLSSLPHKTTDEILALDRLLPAMDWIGETVIMGEWLGIKGYDGLDRGVRSLPYDETLLDRVTEWVAKGCTEWSHFDSIVVENSEGKPIWCELMYPMKGFEEAPKLILVIKNYKPAEHELKIMGY
jgi:hypothetical protein